jgi:hypothetical protein
MAQLPSHPEGEGAQAAYHVVPDRVKGGWNVYATHKPQEPQEYFATKEQAIAFAEHLGFQEGVGYIVQENESVKMR